MLDVCILGPLDVRRGGVSLPLGGQRMRAVLAILALRLNRVVSAGTLVSAIWGDDAKDTAMNTLQVYVGKLRKVLEPERESRGTGLILVTRDPGYVLQLPHEHVDAHRFERLAQEGRAALSDGRLREGTTLLQEALQLWRGPVLADLAGELFVEGSAVRWEELRLSAFEDRIDADLSLGRHAAAIAELEELVVEHPYRERLHEQLMLALYRAGRQADALHAFQRARDALVDRLGIDPGARLRVLEQAILTQSPELDLPPQSPVHARAAADRPIENAQEIDAPGPTPSGMRAPAVEPEPSSPSMPPHRSPVTVVYVLLDGLGADETADPEEIGERVGPVLESVAAILADHGATVVRPGAYHVEAAFGISGVASDDARRALLAALAASSEVASRVGVASGVALVAAANGPPAVIGRAAAQAAAGAGRSEVVVDRLTIERSTSAVRAVERPDGSFRLVDIARRSLSTGALIGRDAELGLIDAALAQVIERSAPHVVVVTGEPGIGASRLLAELSDRWPMVATSVVFAGSERVSDAVRVAEEMLGRLRPDFAPVELTNLAEAEHELLQALLTVEAPVVVIIDDADRLPPSVVAMLEDALVAASARPILMVMKGEQVTPERSTNFLRVALGPLRRAHSVELVARLTPNRDNDAIDAIVQRSGGNPYVLEALTRQSIAGPVDVLPASVELLHHAVLDRVSPMSARLLGFLAAAPDGLDDEALGHLPVATGFAAVKQLVHSLQAHDLAHRHPSDGRLRPRHRTLGEIAFARLPRRDRVGALRAVLEVLPTTEPGLIAATWARTATVERAIGDPGWIESSVQAARSGVDAAWRAVRVGDARMVGEHLVRSVLLCWNATPRGLEPMALHGLLGRSAPTTPRPPTTWSRRLPGSMQSSTVPTPRADVLVEHLDAPLARVLRASLHLATGDRNLARLLLARQPDEELDDDWEAMRDRLLSPTAEIGVVVAAAQPADPILSAATESYRLAQSDRAAIRSSTTEAWQQLIETAPGSVPVAALHVMAGLSAAVDGRVETAEAHLARARELDGALTSEMAEQLVARAWIDARRGSADARQITMTALERAIRTNDPILRAEAAAALVLAGGLTRLSALENASSPDAMARWREILGFTSPG